MENAQNSYNFVSTYLEYHKDISFGMHANPANLVKEKFSLYRTYHEYL